MQGRTGSALTTGLLLGAALALSLACRAEAPSIGDMPVLWPSAALFLLAMARIGPRRLPFAGAVVLGMQFAASMLAGQGPGAGLAAALLDTGLLCAIVLLMRGAPPPHELARDAEAIVFRTGAALLIIAAFAVPAGIAQAGFTRAGQDAAFAWLTGRGFAIVVLTPLLLAASSLLTRGRRLPARLFSTQAIVGLGVLVLSNLLIFAQSTLPVLFVAVLLATAAALMFGQAGAVAAVIVTMAVGGLATMGRSGPVQLMPGGIAERLIMFQFFCGALFVATMAIAARMTERARLLARAQSSESRFRQLVDRSFDVIFETDARGCWTFLNPSWEALTGRHVQDSIGTNSIGWIDEGQRGEMLHGQQRLWRGEIEETQHEVAFRRADGAERCAWIRCRLMTDEAGRPCGTWGTIHDITDRKIAESAAADATARLLAMANTDDLTGIANRRHFLSRLQEEVDRSRRSGSPFLLAIFDVDHFKQVNDTHGHATGDAVLRAVASMAVSVVRSTDLVARIGGEEFAILMPDTRIEAGRVAAHRLLHAVAGNAVPGAGGRVQVTISIGLAGWSGTTSAEDLMRAADKALYQAKRDGRNRLAAA